MKQQDKIVYDDNGQLRVLKGTIISSDNLFVKILLPNGSVWEIARDTIKSMRKVKISQDGDTSEEN